MSWIKKAVSPLLILIIISSFSTPPVYASFFSMSFLFGGNSETYRKSVAASKGAVNVIAPDYFSLSKEGTLVINSNIDKSFILEMQKQGIKVTPFLSNSWNREIGRLALANREQLADDIVAVINKYNLDGLNVDIENTTTDDTANYNDFVRLLREKLPKGKILSTSVAANPSGLTTGWAGSYDYAELIKHCDFLMLMTYDESYNGGPEGPVASGSFVEKSIVYALKSVPAEKLVLGIPFYGRFWGEGRIGEGIACSDVENLISKYGATANYDYEKKSAIAIVDIRPNQTESIYGGRKLYSGTYTIWYENENSLKYKLALVNKYKLKGAASWSLGQESKKTWDFYSLWLTGSYFTDVAKDYWARDYICKAHEEGILYGTKTTEFSPESPLTRAEAASIIVRMKKLSGTEPKTSFSDVKGHWAEREINILKSEGIAVGMQNNNFEPDSSITRAQVAALMSRAFQFSGNSESVMYTDVTKSHWAYSSIALLSKNDILSGFPDGSFKPEKPITRAEFAAIIARLI